MFSLRILAIAASAALLSACSSLPSLPSFSSPASFLPNVSSVFGGSEVPSQVAGSRPDGSLAPGVGRTGHEVARDTTWGEADAEKRSIEKDIPYGVSRP